MKNLIFINSYEDYKILKEVKESAKYVVMDKNININNGESVSKYIKSKENNLYEKEIYKFLDNNKNFNNIFNPEIMDLLKPGVCMFSQYYISAGEALKYFDILRAILMKERPSRVIFCCRSDAFSLVLKYLCKYNAIQIRSFDLKKTLLLTRLAIKLANLVSRTIVYIRSKKPKYSIKDKYLFVIAGPTYRDTLYPIIQKLGDQAIVLNAEQPIKRQTTRVPHKTNFIESYLNFAAKKKVSFRYKFFKQRWHLLKNSDWFRSRFIYKGYDIWPLLLPSFEYMFEIRKKIYDAILYNELANEIINQKPKAIISVEDTNMPSRALINKKIPSLVVQHGIIGEGGLFFGKIKSTKMAVWGPYVKKILKNENSTNKIIVTGFPKLDTLGSLGNNEKKSLRKKNILLITNKVTEKESITFMQTVLSAVKDFDVDLTIKLHSAEKSGFYRRLLKRFGIKARILKDVNLYSLLKKMDLIITYYSTVALEALLLNKPVIILEAGLVKTKLNFGKEVFYVKNSQEIKNIMSDLMLDRLKEIVCPHKFIKNNFYKLDGKASDRIINVLENLESN